MIDVESLLPNNATSAERALESAIARASDVPVVLREMWNPDTCPASLLPWLAWAFSVDQWDPSWSDEAKRDVVRASVAVHRKKGTPGAVKAAVEAAGYLGAQVVERFGWEVHDGVRLYDGTITHEPPDHWAEYRVRLARPITNAQADQVRSILASFAPTRAHLKLLQFTEVAHIHDGAIVHDGIFNHGAA